MSRFGLLFCTLFTTLTLWAQEPEYLEFVKTETRLQQLFTRLYTDSLSDVEPILDTIRAEMSEALVLPGSMNFPWNRLDKIGIITSADKRMRIFSWHYPDDHDHYRYFGIIQLGMKKGKSRIYELRDNGKPQKGGMMKADQSTDDWYGKLYYQILVNEDKRKTYYTVLGMDFNDSRSTIKSVEVLSIQRNTPSFEKSLFFNGRDFYDRFVLEYSGQVAISARYDPGTAMITFDHLVPLHPIYENNFEFYGPDGSFDGLEFSGGVWNYRDDIDARNID